MNIEALKRLNSFTGTKQYWKSHLFGNRVVYSDGAKALFEHGDCYWLHDKIAALQLHPKIKDDKMLQSMQFWTLKVSLQTHRATLICERDTNDVAYSEEIEYTDFPLAEMRLYVGPTETDGTIKMVIYLPSEY